MNKQNLNPHDTTFPKNETIHSTELKSNKKEHTDQFNSCAQINLKHIEDLIILNRLNPHALSIFLFILKNMDQYNALVCSQAMLMEYFNLSRSTINRCISDLKKNGFIYITKTGSSNVYLANDNLVWKTSESDVKHCKFPANVILSLSEQDKHYGMRSPKSPKK